MKIIKKVVDKRNKSGFVEMIAEHQDDIFALSSIISEGDFIYSSTSRKIQIDNKTQQRISLSLKIKIEAFNIDLENSMIYAKGKTSEPHEHVRIGSYHTIDISLGQKFELHKSEWENTMIKMLHESTKVQPETIFIIFYDKEVVISVVSQTKINIIYKQEMKGKKYTNIIKTLEKYADSVQLFVVAGFSDIRNDFYKNLNTSNVLKKIIGFFCVVKLTPDCKGSSNSKVISNLLTNSELSKTFKNIQFVEDLKEIENFFVMFAKSSDLISIGMREIEEAIDYGAIDKLMIIDELYRPNSVDDRRKMEEFCKNVRSFNCKVFVIPSIHFLGEKLKEMGGICATLKFSFK